MDPRLYVDPTIHNSIYTGIGPWYGSRDAAPYAYSYLTVRHGALIRRQLGRVSMWYVASRILCFHLSTDDYEYSMSMDVRRLKKEGKVLITVRMIDGSMYLCPEYSKIAEKM